MNFLKKGKSLIYKQCHEGTIKVFEDPSTLVPYYGGGTSRDLVIYSGHLIVAMANIDTESVNVFNLDAPDLLKYNNPTVRVFCPDFGVPGLEQKFWLDLINVINTEWKAKRITGVTFCCIGGHGRTGTALSIMAGLTGACSTDPVLFIRKNYCEKVVESKAQLKYIEEMTGIKVTADTSKSCGYTSPYQGQSDFDWDDNSKYYGYNSFDEYKSKNENERDTDLYGYKNKRNTDLYGM